MKIWALCTKKGGAAKRYWVEAFGSIPLWGLTASPPLSKNVRNVRFMYNSVLGHLGSRKLAPKAPRGHLGSRKLAPKAAPRTFRLPQTSSEGSYPLALKDSHLG